MPENDVTPAALSGATVFIKPKRARPFFGRHPWALDSAILRVDGNPNSGDVVDVVTHDGNFIARGLWNASSRIRAGGRRPSARGRGTRCRRTMMESR